MIPWRKKLLIGSNLKMYKNTRQTLEYLKDLEGCTRDLVDEGIYLFILPGFTTLPIVSREIDPCVIRLGAQNMCWEDTGQFTGEVSPLMLQEMEIQLVMIGHSERRKVFGETDLTVNQKVLAGLRHEFTTLVCIGEDAEDKRRGITPERLRQQVKLALYGVEEGQANHLWLAYEPAWAIGVGSVPATPEYANESHTMIRDVLVEIFPRSGMEIPILYGGSVNLENAADLLRQSEVDGLFIGRSAWEAARFNQLIRKVLPVWIEKAKQPFDRSTRMDG